MVNKQFMQKLTAFIILSMTITANFSACGNADPKETTYISSDSSIQDDVTGSSDLISAAEENEKPTSFGISFSELITAFSDAGKTVAEQEPQESEKFYIQAAKIGDSTFPRWVYCFSNKDNHDEIIGIKISCKQGSPKVESSTFLYSFNSDLDIILDTIGITPSIDSDVETQEIDEDGYFIKTEFLREKSSSDIISGDVLFSLNKDDFSEEKYQGAQADFGLMLITESTPVATWEEVVTGNYNGQFIYIDGVVDNYRETSTGITFNCFFETSSGYEVETMYPNEDLCPEGLKNGDVIRMTQKVVNDNCIGQSFRSASIIDTLSIEDVHQSYKNGCPELDYESVIRQPVGLFDDYINCQFTGEILQIIEEGGDYGEPVYLIKSGENIVYCRYSRSSENREMRFIEGDTVTICGECQGLTTYNTLIGENTVPQINAYIIDLQ